MRHRKVLLLLPLVLLLAACPWGTYRKVMEAENGVAQSIGAGTNIVSTLYDSQIIDRDEKNIVAGALLDANTLLDKFNQGAKAVHAAGDNKAAYFALADSLLAGVKDLHAQGKLRIKNETAKAQVDALFASIEASIGILRNAIQGA